MIDIIIALITGAMFGGLITVFVLAAIISKGDD